MISREEPTHTEPAPEPLYTQILHEVKGGMFLRIYNLILNYFKVEIDILSFHKRTWKIKPHHNSYTYISGYTTSLLICC
jgi:hypothetical protein